MLLIGVVHRRRALVRGAKRAIGARCDRARRSPSWPWSGIPDATSADLALNGAFFAAAYLVRFDDAQPPALQRAARSSAPPTLERERDEEAKRAVADERLRIAQELHDVVAHSMGVIAVQAGVGAHVIDTDPAEAKKSLEAIAHTSRSTLTEIRRMLGVLRADERRVVRSPRRASPTSIGSSATSARAGLPVDVRDRRRAATSCRPASTSPRTASCRRR